MVIFHSYVSLPEGKYPQSRNLPEVLDLFGVLWVINSSLGDRMSIISWDMSMFAEKNTWQKVEIQKIVQFILYHTNLDYINLITWSFRHLPPNRSSVSPSNRSSSSWSSSAKARMVSAWEWPRSKPRGIRHDHHGSPYYSGDIPLVIIDDLWLILWWYTRIICDPHRIWWYVFLWLILWIKWFYF